MKRVLKNVTKQAFDKLDNIFHDKFNKILSEHLTHDRSHMLSSK